MALYIKPNYGFSLKRKATDEELNFVLRLIDDQSNEKIDASIKISPEKSTLMFLYPSQDSECIHAGEFFNVGDLFEFSVKEKQKLKIDFEEFIKNPELPESLKDLSQWEEKILMEVTT